MTDPTPSPAPKKKRIGRPPRKGTDAALALRTLYENGTPSERDLIRATLPCGVGAVRAIADAFCDIDDEGRTLALDLFAVVDAREKAAP